MKICSNCNSKKNESEFTKNKNTKDGLEYYCKICLHQKKKKYRSENRGQHLKYKQKYRSSHSEEIAKKSKDYYQNNKTQIQTSQQNYYLGSKQKINKRNNIYNQKRLQKDPSLRLRQNISNFVNKYLKQQNSTKEDSFLIYLDYSIEELKIYLESLFEPWMSWDNWGRASIKCRTWNIDHIIPQSALPFSSMKDPNFKKCWALENLRPMESISNIRKSNKLVDI